MSEAEIVYQLSEAYNRMWGMLQWWTSISFGVFITAHLAVKKLNGFLVTILLLLYSAFSFHQLELLLIIADVAIGFTNDLQAISNSGITLAKGSSAYLEQGNSKFLLIITLAGTYLGAISYLIYGYIKSKRESRG